MLRTGTIGLKATLVARQCCNTHARFARGSLSTIGDALIHLSRHGIERVSYVDVARTRASASSIADTDRLLTWKASPRSAGSRGLRNHNRTLPTTPLANRRDILGPPEGMWRGDRCWPWPASPNKVAMARPSTSRLAGFWRAWLRGGPDRWITRGVGDDRDHALSGWGRAFPASAALSRSAIILWCVRHPAHWAT